MNPYRKELSFPHRLFKV